MIRTLAAYLTVLVLGIAAPAHAEIIGQASVIDGDILDIHGQRIRLHGIDAPESSQLCRAAGAEYRCGQQAALALDDRIGGATVTCSERDVDQYGRIVAVCFARGEDLNAWMVLAGWAVAYREYSEDYLDEETAARTAGRGIWRGEFVMPWDWRRGERLPALPSALGECLIKGNVARDGERIYHVPGGQYYEVTVISAERGERWFCSEAEAVAAGWRRSLR